jgi:hypothetical protein
MRTRSTLLIIVLGFALAVSAIAGAQAVGGQPTSPESAFWKTVRESANFVASVLAPILATVAGIGAATMAAQQALKDLFYIRRRFNRRVLTGWVCTRVGANDKFKALASLERLSTSGEADALYSLDSGKLASQIAAAGLNALDQPDKHRELISCLMCDAPFCDYQLTTDPAADRNGVNYIKAKERMTAYMQRAVEGLQIMIDYRWTHANQLAAFLLNTAVFVLLWFFWSKDATHFIFAILAALLGGFIAPVAKDLVTALQSLKGIKT